MSSFLPEELLGLFDAHLVLVKLKEIEEALHNLGEEDHFPVEQVCKSSLDNLILLQEVDLILHPSRDRLSVLQFDIDFCLKILSWFLLAGLFLNWSRFFTLSGRSSPVFSECFFSLLDLEELLLSEVLGVLVLLSDECVSVKDQLLLLEFFPVLLEAEHGLQGEVLLILSELPVLSHRVHTDYELL